MTKKEIWIDFTLQTVTPYHIGSGFRAGGILDNGLVKEGDGLPYIPASSIKGRLRYFAKQLCSIIDVAGDTAQALCNTAERRHYCYPADKVRASGLSPCLICRLFGSPAFPGSLLFQDATLALLKDNQDLLTSERAGVMINRTTRTAKTGHLFFTETGIDGLLFSSQIEGEVVILDENESPPKELTILVSALKMLDHIGGQRSRGLGRLQTTLRSIKLDGHEISTTSALTQISEGN